ncbi:unnamed protein product [Paramecium primaurelia]|uniref:Transmembrane protein n=1 Tax=Paramecium primaurelia TaxID=5886 RepID=A0A8S1MMJ2_PARPR|nr:unnamed protein product [Paramecium primaurelia]
MPNQLSEEQLSQKIITIEIAKRPLQSSQLKVNLLKSASQWMNEFLGKIFPLHYAIIVKTEEKGQYILHNLQEGFTCSTITDEEKHHYQQYEIYQQDQFNKIFTVQDIYDQSSQHKKYNLISNSCIHYVNFVKKYINEFLKDINNQATDRVQIQSLLQTAKILIKSSFQNIVNNSIDMSLINKLAQVNLKDPSFYFDIISEIIRCSKQQSIWEIFGNAVIITIISIINLIPLVNGVIAAGAILVELYFIWNQSDESIYTRSIKSLYVMGQFALGVTIGQVSLHDLFDMCYELIQKLKLQNGLKIKILQVVVLLWV